MQEGEVFGICFSVTSFSTTSFIIPVVCGMAKFLLYREVSADKNAVKGKTK